MNHINTFMKFITFDYYFKFFFSVCIFIVNLNHWRGIWLNIFLHHFIGFITLNKNFELWNLIKYNTINHLFNFQICVLSLDAALFVLDLWCFFLSSVSVLWVATIFVNTVPSALSPLSTPQGATLRNPKKWFKINKKI